MVPGDRLFCIFLEPYTANYTFKDWPLHITIVPWFRTDISAEELGMEVDESLDEVEPFMVRVGVEARFGHRGRKLVNLIDLPSPLETIEKQIRDILHAHHAWLVDETTKKHRAFRPHVTTQKSGRLHEGNTFRCDSLYIVEQKGEYKEIVSRIAL
ncbi:MAG: hypothetical protein JWP13_379 [Candidatus Saccharibacteria bacterium]|nr:hypothetical protein [Candidatus Saccharibacteria bacterium]